MALKFPLEMKDGVYVRTISELKEYFDIEKAVGYFLNGKLKKWLDVRRYEDEAKAVEMLNQEDPLLAKHLCEIFGVKYEEAEIDTEEIAVKNARIAKLKQYTDDEEILRNADAVAFNQEDLADLYDKDVRKIYLCEGKFSIPESKRALEYVMIGEVSVGGLQNEDRKESQLKGKSTIHFEIETQSSISQDLADVIGDRHYAESENYVVWGLPNVSREIYAYYDENFFKKNNAPYFQKDLNIWDKRANEYFSVDVVDGSLHEVGFVGNKLVVNGMYIYEIESRGLKCIYKKPTVSRDFSISNHRIAFRPYDKSNNKFSFDRLLASNMQQHSIVILDTETMEEFDTRLVPTDQDFRPGYFKLINNRLFFVNNDNLYCYDIDKRNSVEVVFKQSDFRLTYASSAKLGIHNPTVACYNDEVFIRYDNEYTKEGKLIGINLASKHIVQYLDKIGPGGCYIANQLGMLIIKKFNGVYIFDMNSKKSEFLPLESCEVISVVGNYLYYRTYHDKLPTHRVDLRNYHEGSKEITYESAFIVRGGIKIKIWN